MNVPYGFRVRCPQPQGRRELDHRVELRLNQFPRDRTRQDRLYIRVWLAFALLVRPVQTLLFEVFEARQQFEPQEVTKGEAHLALPVGVHVVLSSRLPCPSRGVDAPAQPPHGLFECRFIAGSRHAHALAAHGCSVTAGNPAQARLGHVSVPAA